MWRLLALVPLAGCDLVFHVDVPDAPVGCFSDTFDGPDFDPAKWSDFPASPLGPAIVDGHVVFDLAAANGNGFVASPRLLDLTDAYMEVEVIEAPDANSGGGVTIVAGSDETHYIWFGVGVGLTIGGLQNGAFVIQGTQGTTYDPVQRRLRVTFAANAITYQALDANGMVLDEESLPTAFPLNALAVELAASTENNTLKTQAVLDNLIVDGPNCANMQ